MAGISIIPSGSQFQLAGSNLEYQTLITRQTDFYGKVIGRTWDVPHSTYRVATPTPLNATFSGWTEESDQSIWSQDGALYTVSTTVANQYRLQRYSFDILTIAKRTPGIPSTVSLSDLKNKLISIVPTWVGYGSGASGGMSVFGIKVTIRNNTTNAWDTLGSNSASSPSAVSATITNFNDYIDTNGFVHIMVYPINPSDGTIPCAINTDYVNLEFTTTGTFSSTKATSFDARGKATVSVSSTAVSLGAIPKGAMKALITVETADVRFWIDGSTPTTSEGHLVSAGGSIKLDSPGQLIKFKAISVGGTAILQATYY